MRAIRALGVFLSFLLAPSLALAAVTATVTPGDWPLYRGTSIVSRHATLEACVEAAKALGVTRSYTCRTSAGVAVEVTVDPPPPPPPPPPAETATLSASPQTVASGAASSLTWSSTGAASCALSAMGQSQTVPTAGSVSTGPLTQTVTVTLTCGAASDSETITVGSTPPPDDPPPPPPPPTGGSGVTSAWWLDAAERDRLVAAIQRGDSEATYWVNLMASAYANRTGYNDIPNWQIALAGNLLGRADYCTQAVAEAQSIVSRDPSGANIRSTSETFLRIPELYDAIALPWAFCKPQTTAAQRAAWATYLNAGLDAMWVANGNYWPFDDPHNNYFHHYMYVTALVGVVTEGDNARASYWRGYYENKFANRLIPAWTPPRWVGAGGSEGHYYDAYIYRALWTAHAYGKATGQNIVGRFGFTVPEYLNSELHSTRPDFSGFWQMGDEANVASAPFTTNNRSLWLLLMRLAPSSVEAGHAKTLLALSSTGRDYPGRNQRVWSFVWSDRDVTAQPLSTKTDTTLTLPSSGRTFIRTDWTQAARGLVLFHNRVDNTPGESHDHVDAPGFQWSAGGTPLVVDPNAYGSSGIVGTQSNGGATVANIVRLPNATTTGGSPVLTRAEDNRGAAIPYTVHAINAQPYWNNASVYRREYVTLDSLRVVIVYDRIVGGGAKTWQMHVPTGAGPRVLNLYPAGALTTSAVSGFSGVSAIRQADASDDYRSLKVLDTGGRVASASLAQGAGYLEAVVTIDGVTRRVRFFDSGASATVR